MDSSRRIRAKIAKRRCSALIARTSHRTTSSTASILSSTRRAGTRREAAQFAGEKRHNDALDRSIRFRDVARELAMSRRVHRFVVLVVGAPSGRRRSRRKRLSNNFLGFLGRRRGDDARRRERHGLGHDATTHDNIGPRDVLPLIVTDVALVALGSRSHARQIP